MLTVRQRAAVVAHERAHLEGRHDLVLLPADVVATSFGFVHVFAVAARRLRLLVEMLADDRAAAAEGAEHLAAALLGLGERCSPQAKLGATNGATAQRILRLIEPASDAPLATRSALVAGLAGVLSPPWLITVGRAVAAAAGLCLPQ